MTKKLVDDDLQDIIERFKLNIDREIVERTVADIIGVKAVTELKKER